jgi:UDP-N-acetylglucosamine transferase subunit ALG13
MIFVTVGTQLPFERLVRAVDHWAGCRAQSDVFAQVGPSRYLPRHIESVPFLDAAECRRYAARADVIVSHAGMGSILTAMELGKPIIVMPRRADLGEHRNDHQMATANHWAQFRSVAVAFDDNDLLARLDELHALDAPQRISSHASPQLLATIRDFVEFGVPVEEFGVPLGIDVRQGQAAALEGRHRDQAGRWAGHRGLAEASGGVSDAPSAFASPA